jgi:Plasmid pRiA4b ORF-3-like protein
VIGLADAWTSTATKISQRAACAPAAPAPIRDARARAVSDGRADIDEATAVVRWLLEGGVEGLGLTKSHALRRAIVREAAERRPQWWRHDLLGRPHREADLRVLAETDAALLRMRCRRETLLTTARGRQLLADPEALLSVLQQALGWWDDHLYSFWLHGSFFGSDDAELTSPLTPDEGVATADLPIAELGRRPGHRIGYVFDFGDDWRVRLKLRERIAAEPGDHPRVLELHGTPPPQYAALDD